MQEEVIQNVLDGKDTLALMPTGGGKSICFQLPALLQEGICLVISPLIALMKDQVSNLQKRGVKAIALTGGMSLSEIDIALDNCLYDNYKFLYLSPERLKNSMVQERLKKMKINLIAVDEAHCISEWGYDFRPSYLEIVNLRAWCQAPILALTATATPEVAEDIAEKLDFQQTNCLRKSFHREKLSYVVRQEADKRAKLIRILQRVPGSAIVYCASRKACKQLQQLLIGKSISAHFYHGGLQAEERDIKQKEWQENRVRVMVATNAFGMGIDKADVRLVIHMQLPLSIEAYFQEAGRAGRDEKMAYAILLHNKEDEKLLQQHIENNYPSISFIRNVYQQLANHLGIAIGAGKDECFSFSLNEFCEKYQTTPSLTYNALKILEREGYILLQDGLQRQSKALFKVSHHDLYHYQLSHPKHEPLIKTLLRSYGDLFDDYVKLNESLLAKRAGLKVEAVKHQLRQLHQLGILEYLQNSDSSSICYSLARMKADSLPLSSNFLLNRKNIEQKKADAMLSYAVKEHQCRSEQLLRYFGEKNTSPCGICDVCLDKKNRQLSDQEFSQIASDIKSLLSQQEMKTEEIVNTLNNHQEEQLLETLQFLYHNREIILNKENAWSWKS